MRDRNSTGRFCSEWKPEPTTANEWLIHWHRTRLIRVPTEKGGTATLEIEDITVPNPKHRPDVDAEIKVRGGKSFYIVLNPGKVVRRYDKPVLMMPGGKERAAWWILNSK